jgi:arylsulfatase A-like enzyme
LITGQHDSYGNTSDLAEIMSMYAAMIDRFDQGVGRVLARLE